MFKKIINYQVLLGFNVQQGQYQNNLRHTFAAILLWFIWCLASPLQVSAPIGIMLCILATAGMFVEEQKKQNVQLCVVTDKFRVANLLYVTPVAMLFFCGVILAVFFLLGLVLYFTVISDGMVQWHTALGDMMEKLQTFRTYGVFGILFFGGLLYISWFIKVMFQFQKSKWMHLLGNILLVAFHIGYIAYLRIVINGSTEYGGVGQLKITDLPQIWKGSYIHLIFLWGIVLLLGSIAWIVCNKRMGESITAGQVLSLVETMDAAQKKRVMEKEKKKAQSQAVVAFLLGIFLLAVFGGIFYWILNPTGGEKFSIVVDGTEKNLGEAYDKWDDYRAEIGIDKELWYSHKLSIFPQKVKEENIQTYLAKVEGEFGKNWSSNCGYYRYLECKYSAEDYKKEKDRLCSVKKNCGVLKDTTHFDTLAVIACYNMKFNEFEYALLDDSERQIQYIFCEQSINLEDIKTEHNILPNTMMYQVIPKEERNYQGGFSIYEEKK